MTTDFKKKMELLAKSKLQQDEDKARSVQNESERRRETEAASKQRFNELKKTIVEPLVKELNNAFESTGDKFRLFSNDEAKDLSDRVKTFCQIFYFPKGRPENLVGLNTASIRFECFPSREEVLVSSNTELRPSYLREIETVALTDFDSDFIENTISDFVAAMTAE